MGKCILIVQTIFFLFFIPFPALAQIVINEFCPKCDPEWVELYNDSDQSVDLDGWEIQDGNARSTDDLTITGIIQAHGFIVFEHPKGWLNDSGDDTVKIYNNDPDPVLVDSYSYSQTSADLTFSRIPNGSGQFTAATDPTPNSANQSPPSPSPTPTPSPTPLPRLQAGPTSTPTSTSTPTNTPTPTSPPQVTKTTASTITSTTTPNPTSTVSPPSQLPTNAPISTSTPATLTISPEVLAVATDSAQNYQLNLETFFSSSSPSLSPPISPPYKNFPLIGLGLTIVGLGLLALRLKVLLPKR